jgi:hypothetical protein
LVFGFLIPHQRTEAHEFVGEVVKSGRIEFSVFAHDGLSSCCANFFNNSSFCFAAGITPHLAAAPNQFLLRVHQRYGDPAIRAIRTACDQILAEAERPAFKVWLKGQAITDDAAGDFIKQSFGADRQSDARFYFDAASVTA